MNQEQINYYRSLFNSGIKIKDIFKICRTNKHNLWDMIGALNLHVRHTPDLCKIQYPPVTTNMCLICSTKFSFGVKNNVVYAKKGCKCGYDGKHLTSETKLSVFYDKEVASDLTKKVVLSRTSKLQNTRAHWANLGLSDAEIDIKVSEVQKSRSVRSPSAKKGARGYSKRTKEYWMKKGTAKKKLY